MQLKKEGDERVISEIVFVGWKKQLSYVGLVTAQSLLAKEDGNINND